MLHGETLFLYYYGGKTRRYHGWWLGWKIDGDDFLLLHRGDNGNTPPKTAWETKTGDQYRVEQGVHCEHAGKSSRSPNPEPSSTPKTSVLAEKARGVKRPPTRGEETIKQRKREDECLLSPRISYALQAAKDARAAPAGPKSPKLKRSVDPFAREKITPEGEGYFEYDHIPDFTTTDAVLLGKKRFKVGEELGKGRDGKVYRMTHNTKNYAAKVHKSHTLHGAYHEFNVARELQQRCRDRKTDLTKLKWFMPDEIHEAQGRSGWKTAVVTMRTSESCRSVWECNNAGEAVAAAVLHEVIDALCQLHALGFLHADVKPDNFLLVESKDKGNDLALPVHVMAIDLGRAIDVERERASFKSKNHVKPFKCPEMDNDEAWLYQIDAYGAACVAYGILFGTWFNMKVEQDECDGMQFYRLKRSIPKTMDTDLWNKAFGVLLNGFVRQTAGTTFNTGRLASLKETLAQHVKRRRAETSRLLIKLLRGKPLH